MAESSNSSSSSSSSSTKGIPAHNIFRLNDGVTFSSMFDNGNLARVERVVYKSAPVSKSGGSSSSNIYHYKIWTACDNQGTERESRHCSWFHFTISGLPVDASLRIQIANSSSSSGLYKHDMRPVVRSNATNQKWTRLRNKVLFVNSEENSKNLNVMFEHAVELADDTISFACTYPYSYTMLQEDLGLFDTHVNRLDVPESIYYCRELLVHSSDGLRLDLLTISSVDGASNAHEETLAGLFPGAATSESRPLLFRSKQVVFVSARVHPGEVPAQHVMKGMLSMLLDKNNVYSKELRKHFVFKIVPMLNPDGVYRGHFRMDQHGQNLNRYYLDPDQRLQPAVFASKRLIDLYAQSQQLAFYLDLHAHASKRGCFMYGNVIENAQEQTQNQLFCKLIGLNTPHFDYPSCLFSKEHMSRIDPGDKSKGLTAEGCGRVSTYLAHGIIHSYTLECSYNSSKGSFSAEAAQKCNGVGGRGSRPELSSGKPEPYNPLIYAGVGRAILIAILDITDLNPIAKLDKLYAKKIEQMLHAVGVEVRNTLGSSRPVRRRAEDGSDGSIFSSGSTEPIAWSRCASSSPSATPSSSSGDGSSENSNRSVSSTSIFSNQRKLSNLKSSLKAHSKYLPSLCVKGRDLLFLGTKDNKEVIALSPKRPPRSRHASAVTAFHSIGRDLNP